MVFPKVRILAIPFLVAALGGCAGMEVSPTPAAPPAKSSNAEKIDAVNGAKDLLRMAKAAGGETASPYDFYLAEEYLDLAVQEMSGGDRDGVVEFAEKSKIHSAFAIRMAERGVK